MKEGAVKKDYTIPALFVTAVVLVVVFLVVSLMLGKNYPSIKNGATTSQVEDYAYSLLKKDDGTNNLGYNEAVAYYTSQIEASKDKEQKFNLMLDFAIFYGKTGDPYSGLQVLGNIDEDVPPDAKYYLYTTYIYLYGRLNDEDMVASYQQRIIDEKIPEYFAGLDDGTINPEDYKAEKDESNIEEDAGEVDSAPGAEEDSTAEPEETQPLNSLFTAEGL